MKYSYLYFLFFIFLFFAVSVNGQLDDQKPKDFYKNAESTDFEVIKAATEQYYIGKPKGKGSGYKQWKRWEERNELRLNPEGQIFNYSAKNFEEYRKLVSKQDLSKQQSSLNTWEKWGDNQYETGEQTPGTGVINCIAFHPTDVNTFYASGPATGLMKTTNHGTTWTNITDDYFGNVGISSIVVNYNNPLEIYILTGDGDGWDTNSIGIYKTVNGGTSWFATGLTWNESEMKRGFKLSMNPIFPSRILAATSEGIYWTVDGGISWHLRESGYFYDITFAPGSQLTAYASTENLIYRSQDGGSSWTFINIIPLAERVQLSVSASDPDIVYALGSGFVAPNNFPGLIVSNDKGDNWVTQSTSPAICVRDYDDNSGQFSYNIDFAVNPYDHEEVIMGAISVWASTDSGSAWDRKTLWYDVIPISEYVHADIHGIEFNPLNGNAYICSDGGIYYTTDLGESFEDLSRTMNIGQFYDFAGTPQNSNLMIGGLYHNGTRILKGETFAEKIGTGDGTGCMIDHEDQETIYLSSQFGNIRKSTNGGSVSFDRRPWQAGVGVFNTHFAMNPTDSDIIYAGWSNDTVYRSYDKAETWVYSVFPYLFLEGAGDVTNIAVASDGTTVYACTTKAVWKSTDYGITWNNIFSDGDYFTSVIPVDGNPDLALITRGRYDDDDKVYLYNDGTITNITYNLPNVPAHISAFYSDIVVGTDVGVFKLDDSGTSWSLYSNGMPNTIVRDLEVYPAAGILRAATFGRGIWQVKIECKDDFILTEANDPTGSIPIYQSIQANNTITSSRKILGNTGEIIYNAGELVILKAGFLAAEGNKVLIGNAGCGESID